jgi:hypothetical protein
MDLGEILNLAVLIVVIYLAFRIGAVLMKIVLGLVAIALVWWLVSSLVDGFAAPWTPLAAVERALTTS